MLEKLKKEVYEANMELPRRGLITYTWGNVSGMDRETGYFVIKPSGVAYDRLTPEDMVVMDLEGKKIEGALNPSSDTATQKISGNRRYCPYTFPGSHRMGPGRKKHSTLRNHPCGLFLRPNPLCQKSDPQRNRGGLREEYRAGDHRNI